jgi:hypothetical protein
MGSYCPFPPWQSELPEFGCGLAITEDPVDRMHFVVEDLRISGFLDVPAD